MKQRSELHGKLRAFLKAVLDSAAAAATHSSVRDLTPRPSESGSWHANGNGKGNDEDDHDDDDDGDDSHDNDGGGGHKTTTTGGRPGTGASGESALSGAAGGGDRFHLPDIRASSAMAAIK